ncbi:MAG: efflux transporter outer membrane subunit [Endomicrobiales bacterium]
MKGLTMCSFGKTHHLFNVRALTMAALLTLLCGCSVGPKYVKPATTVPSAFKESGNWKESQPRENISRGDWWKVFKDDGLNALENQVDISNQNIVAAVAQVQQARALLKGAKAAYYPTISVGVGSVQTSTGAMTTSNTSNAAYANLSWELDVWGKVRRNVESNRSNVQASAADLETMRLSIHATLAQDYFLLRSLDTQQQIVNETIDGYKRFLQMTKNRYNNGVASQADVMQADTQYKTTLAQGIDIGIQRAMTEHAIAILVGKLPSVFSVPVSTAPMCPPEVPLILPSELLERRPDIAAAERRVQVANAQIGVAKSAFFPSFSLSATREAVSNNWATLFSLPNQIWSIGPEAAETLFAGGAIRAQVAQAKAAYSVSVATYKQTVLTGFQDVEDNLSSVRILEQEAAAEDEAVKAAHRSLVISLNQYQAGTISALDVVTAQIAELSNRKTALNILYNRMSSSISLIRALGGGWDVSMLPYADNKKAK